ncbi:acylase [Corallococcus sp. CA047B]|nr:acylase [Corallococcus sp. CA047B]
MLEHTPDSLPPRGGFRTSLRARRWSLSLLTSLALVATAGCDDDKPVTPEPTPAKYTAKIRRTSHGIPHITADNYGSLGFGQGYAFAQDHVCTLADQIIKVRSERARYLGQGPGNTYVGSDLAYLSLGVIARAEAAFPQLSEEVQQMLTGYVAGYNKYIAETPPAERPADCANADWVKPITAVDLLAYDIDLTLVGGINQLALTIAAATPPAVGAQSVDKQASLRPQMPTLEQLRTLRQTDFGSNGWALGAERTDNGKGMVMANPHFPWEGELRLWESQLTVPGQMNVYGVGLMGVPAVLIGFNENVAWTHTFSSGQRMTMYQVNLVPGKPTTYKYGTEERAMTSKNFTILVKLPEGSVTNYSQTMYFTHYGPIIAIPDSAAPGFPPGTLGWNTQTALTIRDANIENIKFLDQFHGMNKAKNLNEFKEVYATQQGLPWVNTMYADKEGNAWYTDATPTPNLTKDAATKWITAASTPGLNLTYGLYNALGIVFLDGSDPANEWQVEPGSRSPGLVPFAKVPQLDRRDFVFNANDSYWLSNPAAPLTGFSPLHGIENTPQTPRTRMNLITLTEKTATGASGADGKFSLEELKAAVFSNRSSMAELTREGLVARCTGRTTPVMFQGMAVDITQACALLAGWDGRFDTSSKGAFVFREFLGAVPGASLVNKGILFNVPFDPADPINTPNTLTPAPETGEDPLLLRLAQGVASINASGIALDKTLGEVQYTARSGARVPIQGGLSREGITNVVAYGVTRTTLFEYSATRGPLISGNTGLSNAGYPINNGSSFVMAMQFTDAGPTANAVLTYSESGDPKSPFYSDQTQLFSQKKWRPILFTDAQIAADAALVETNISGG